MRREPREGRADATSTPSARASIGQGTGRASSSVPANWSGASSNRRAPCLRAAQHRWFAPDFAIEIGLGISQHPRVPTTRGGRSDHARFRARNRSRRPSRQALLEPVAEVRDLPAAGPPGGDDERGGGALAGGPQHHLPHPGGGQGRSPGGTGQLPPGARSRERDLELESARADAARLGEALKEMAVKLMLVEGKGRWG